MAQRRRIKVQGLVQGVGFRFATRRKAQRLGVSGWVKNMVDGTVEAEIVADGETLETMIDWLRHGPRNASVTRIEIQDLGEADQGEEFIIA